MKFSFYINSEIEFISDQQRMRNNPFNIPASKIKGKRFDTFIAYESGRVFLDAMLNACSGNKKTNVPLIIQPVSKPSFCVNATFFPKKMSEHGDAKIIKVVFD